MGLDECFHFPIFLPSSLRDPRRLFVVFRRRGAPSILSLSDPILDDHRGVIFLGLPIRPINLRI